MTVIVCIDNAGGMLFNKRRQSKDKLLLEDIKRLSGSKEILISPFSEKLISTSGIPYRVLECPLREGGGSDILFVENFHLKEYIDIIDTLIIYKWNRDYPSDFYLDIDTKKDGFRIKSRREFKGNSHEKITREDYTK